MNKEEFNKFYEEMKNSRFRQQKFPGWRPLPTISCMTIIFISVGIFFIIVGVLILVFTGFLKEYKFRYDLYCYNKNTCDFSFTIPEKMKKPILIYYQVNDVRQNHRFYMDNKSDKQLKGEEVSKEDLEKSGDCESALYNKDFGLDSDEYDEDSVAFPCGLIAKSFLQDNFSSWTISKKEINVTTEDIAYKSDRDTYSKIAKKETHWINLNDEHFMNWMRIAPFENPRKLWGKIEKDDIPSGAIVTVAIYNHDKYRNFEKYLILTTRNVFGGKSSFLGISYIVFGGICLLSAVIFINVFNYFHKKKK